MNKKILEFLNYLPGQKEVALVVLHDSEELRIFSEALEARGLTLVYSVSELLECLKSGEQVCLLADSFDAQDSKNLYDLAAQYPTGQVQIWNKEGGSMVTVSPSYEGYPPVYLTNTQNLSNFADQGFDLRKHVGLSYQTA